MGLSRCRSTGKVKFDDKYRAGRVADRIALRRWNHGENAWMDVYYCKACKRWHVGTVKAKPREYGEQHWHKFYYSDATRHATRRRIRAGNVVRDDDDY